MLDTRLVLHNFAAQGPKHTLQLRPQTCSSSATFHPMVRVLQIGLGLQTAELRRTMPWMERRMATLAASLWKWRAMSSLPCASSTLNSGASLMHAIFSISAEPLLRLRWSRVLKNALHEDQNRFPA